MTNCMSSPYSRTATKDDRVGFVRLHAASRLEPRSVSSTLQSVIFLALVVFVCGCQPSNQPEILLPGDTPNAPTDAATISLFCGGCHGMPDPANFPKDRWHHEVLQGFELYERSGRTDLEIPDFDATLAWFVDLAPDNLVFEKVEPVDSAALFQPSQAIWNAEPLKAVSHAIVMPQERGRNQICVSDMGSGKVWTAVPTEQGWMPDFVCQTANPTHCEPTDLDRDGRTDFLITDSGGFSPERQRRGTLWWARPEDSGGYSRHEIDLGLIRLADVRTIDFDEDGRQDLIVAEFGWQFEGSILTYRNTGTKNGIPNFVRKRIDSRPGAIHIPVVDLNQDGHDDFIGLVSQHHETVDVFLGDGNGSFKPQSLYSAWNPAYGSSGIELIDMDGDKDIDVLYTNGDTFDDEIGKPIHFVQWLENLGGLKFAYHRIGSMPGVYRALGGDFDSDGDMDVVAVSLLRERFVTQFPSDTFQGVVWYEQTGPGSFSPHSLQNDQCGSATCLPLDMDNDGDLDFLTFPFSLDADTPSAIQFFENKSVH